MVVFCSWKNKGMIGWNEKISICLVETVEKWNDRKLWKNKKLEGLEKILFPFFFVFDWKWKSRGWKK